MTSFQTPLFSNVLSHRCTHQATSKREIKERQIRATPRQMKRTLKKLWSRRLRATFRVLKKVTVMNLICLTHRSAHLELAVLLVA